MASSKLLETHQIQCEPCLYNSIPVAAEFWCLTCKDGLCEGCANTHKGIRATRDHKVIAVQKYHEIKGDVLVTQECKDHGKMFELYCIDHESALCVLCLKNSHKECKVISLDEASKNVTSSTNFTRVEKNIDNLTEFLTEQLEHHLHNLESLSKERSTIGLKINDVIKRLHSQIDRSGHKLREKLYSSYEACRSTISSNIQKLVSKQEELKAIKRKFGHLTEVASNKQLFLAVSDTSSKLLKDLNKVQNKFDDKKISRSLELELSSVLNQVLKLDTLGSISVSEANLSCQCRLMMPEAQLPSQEANVTVDRVTLSKELEVISPDTLVNITTGCILLPNSDMLFSDPRNCSIQVFNSHNSTTVDMKTPFEPCDFTWLTTENNTIAVTYGNNYKFEIADITNYEYKTIRSIKTKTTCYGISSNKTIIAVQCTNEDIHLYSLDGEYLHQLHTLLRGYCLYVSATDDRIFFSNTFKNTICCFDLKGKELWSTQNVLKPLGLTVGSSGELFVVSLHPDQLFVISDDGISISTISTGLTNMTSVSFCKSSRRLLVRSKNKSVVYKVLYK